MAGSIERVLSPEEFELQRYLDEIERLKSDIATKLADLESYKAELARFSAEYHAVLGPLFAELDRLELEIAAYRRKIELLQSNREMPVEQVDEVVENEFQAQHERIRQEEEENRAYERAWDHEQQRPELSEDDAAEFKRVYRELAKKHHPDFAIDEADLIERGNAMKKVNQAFAARDLTSLKNLRDELFDHLAAFERMSIGEKLVWAIREVAQLKTKRVELTTERLQTESSTLSRLFEKEHAIAELARDLEKQITRARRQAEALREAYIDASGWVSTQ